MKRKLKERILDACLEEVLGGKYPPDLTSAILQAWEARQQAAVGGFLDTDGIAPPPVSSDFVELPAPPLPPTAEPLAPPIHRERGVHVVAARPETRRSSARWFALAAAASLLAVLAGAVVYAVRPGWLRLPSEPLAGVRLERRAVTEPPQTVVHDATRPRRPTTWSAPGEKNTPPPAAIAQAAVPPTAVATASPAPVAETPAAIEPRRTVAKPSTDPEVIAFVNEMVRNAWREHSVSPAPPASDEDWCKRVLQRLVGREPTSDDLKQFLRTPAAERRQSLVDRLLASEEYSRHWAGIWADGLMGPQPAAADSPHREVLTSYLASALRDGKSFDNVAFDLLAASGTTLPGHEEFNGAAGFLAAGAADHALEATDRTSRFFLGQQLTCTRCHDHPSGGAQQGDFWELNAFFRQLKLQRDASGIARLTDQDFYGESGAATDAEIFYQLPDGRLKIAYPSLNGREIPRSGLLDDVHRRQELAKLVIAGDDFPRAIVNRTWHGLLGYGFTQPVDDMGPHNPPSHPEVLDRLAGEFAAHEFNLRGLVRWIVLSEPFGLSGKRMPESWMDAPETGGRPLFARAYDKSPQKTSPDVYHALVQAVHQRTNTAWTSTGTLARRSWSPTAPATLQIIEPLPDKSGIGPNWLSRLAQSRLRPEQRIQHVFLSVLGRNPTARELTAARLVVADRLNDAVALRDIWATLLAEARAN